MDIKRIVADCRRRGFIQSLKYIPHWIYEKYNEHRLGINTSGFTYAKDLGITDKDCNHYEPTHYSCIFNPIKHLPIDFKDSVFIDYGSGKGRAVIVASLYPFKKVIGVELSNELNEIAKQNYENVKRKGLVKSSEVELIAMNAFDYIPSDDITVVFLNNPFSEEFMRDVVNKICDSVQRVPRPLYIIFRHPYWTKDILEDDKRFEAIHTFKGFSDTEEIGVIYKKLQ